MSDKEKIRKTPIRRNDMFFSMNDFNTEIEIGKEYMEHDANQTVILYEVDLSHTQVDDIYKEAEKGKIKCKTPVELPVVFELDEPELQTYDKKSLNGYFVKTGKLKFGIFNSTLVEYDCDIKRGDYIGLQVTDTHMEYFTVIDDGRVNFSNKKMLFGTKPYYREVVCAPIDENEFNG